MTARFDEMYMTICKEVGGIEGLLRSFFDFMFRKTDFFYECNPGDTMGFPPGVNTRILLSVFKQYQDEHYKKFPKKDPADYEQKLAKFREEQQKKTDKKQPKAELKETKLPQEPKKTQTEPKPQEQKHEVSKDSAIINTYNGGDTEKYKWSQQSNDIEITMEVPPGTIAKQLNVQISLQHLKVSLKKDGTVLLDGDLYEKISKGNSFWRIENSGKRTFIVLNLEKAEERIWSTIIKGDKEIDTTKVDNSKPLQDFDDETQGALRKIMYQQQRKMQGLPTTEEQQQIESLKRAWDAEGSPFKGTPFDPSKFNLPNMS